MTDPCRDTAQLLDQLRLDDDKVLNELIAHTHQRLRHRASRMLKTYPGVRRWEQTDDVLQNASLRLCRALRSKKPESVRHFYNLAALEIRRELIDLARHHLGPQGQGAKHDTNRAGKAADDAGGPLDRQAAPVEEPASLEAWTAFHHYVNALPEAQRCVVDLHWYNGLTLEQVAAVQCVSHSTVRRNWRSAKIKLAEAMAGETPM